LYCLEKDAFFFPTFENQPLEKEKRRVVHTNQQAGIIIILWLVGKGNYVIAVSLGRDSLLYKRLKGVRVVLVVLGVYHKFSW
jgi:hypothetical protein